MNNKKIQIVIITLLSVMCIYANHFTPFTNGDFNSTILLPAGIVPTIDGVEIEADDEIGLFKSNGVCAGAIVWDGTNDAHIITAWGDNSVSTDTVDGFENGDTIFYRIWDNSEALEIEAISEYSVGDGLFNPGGSYISLLSLTAITPVEITQNPYDQDKYDGDTAVFYVKTVGGSPITYQWQEFITGMSEWSDMIGEVNDSLSFIVSRYDVGRYRCIASNPSGIDTSSDADLTFNNWIPVLSAVASQTINEDSSLTMTLSMMTASDKDDTLSDSSIRIIELDGAHYSVSGNTITPEADWNGVLTIPVFVIDGIPGSTPSDTLNCTLTVSPVNDKPVLVNSFNDTIVPEGLPNIIVLPTENFSDIDINDSLRFTVSGLPAGYNYSNDTISGTSSIIADFDIIISATDDSGAVVSDTFILSIQPVTSITENPIKPNNTINTFSAAPNLVKQSDEVVHLLVNESIIGEGTITVYDNLGDIVDLQNVYINNGGHYEWDLRNNRGQLVTTGIYIAVLDLTNLNGSKERFLCKIGVSIE